MPEQVPVRSVRTGGVDHIEVDTPDEAYVKALLREREGYARYDREERVAAVDAELRRLGVTREDVHEGQENAVSAPQEKAVPRGRRGGR
ncbi:hypothetical protein ACNF49_14100 [Actinomadura sp. ATCC 39365]